MPAPQNKPELASFLGMCNYLSLYIPCLSDITGTLRQLNKKQSNSCGTQFMKRHSSVT